MLNRSASPPNSCTLRWRAATTNHRAEVPAGARRPNVSRRAWCRIGCRARSTAVMVRLATLGTTRMGASLTNDRPDVAFFIPTLAIGGVERVVAILASALAERGHRVDLVVAQASGDG